MQLEQFQLNSITEMTHWWFTGRRRILRDLIAEVVTPSRENIVVDIGCGTGGNIASLSNDYTCVGIDPSREAIDLARRRFSGTEFRCGCAPTDLADIMPRAKLFLLADVLEHVADDFALLSHLMSVASEGAYFLLTVPTDMSLWGPHDETLGHYRRYDRDRFRNVWKGLPVTELLVAHFNGRLYPIIKAVRTLSRWRGKASGEAGTDVKTPCGPLNRMLEHIFGSESRILTDLLHGNRRRGFRNGASVVALLQREAGRIAPRCKPPHLAADWYDPVTGQQADETLKRAA